MNALVPGKLGCGGNNLPEPGFIVVTVSGFHGVPDYDGSTRVIVDAWGGVCLLFVHSVLPNL